jgi:integrase
MTDALRPSELFALRWSCFLPKESAFVINETVYKGKIRPYGKTPKSLSKIHIPQELVEDLLAWKEKCPDPSPEAFIFVNKDGNFHDTDNYRKRVLYKLKDVLGLSKLNFQVLRRTVATLSQYKGSVKDTQGLLRHSRLQTSTDVYMQVVPEGVQKMIDSINRELRKPSSAKSRNTSSTQRSWGMQRASSTYN